MRKVYSGEVFVGYLFERWMNPLTMLAIRYTKDLQGYYISSLLKEDIAMDLTIDQPKPMPRQDHLRIITGGKEPPMSSGNWLLDLPLGSKFSVQSRDNPKNFMSLDLELVNKTNRTAVLYELSSGQPLGGTGRVVASRFVLQFDKTEDIATYEDMLESFQKQKEAEQEANNGRSDRTVEVVDRGP